MGVACSPGAKDTSHLNTQLLDLQRRVIEAQILLEHNRIPKPY